MPRRQLAEPDVAPQINIVPMIDVIFSILAFFIMSTLFLARLESLAVNLPNAKSATSRSPTKATLTISQTGQMYLNRKLIQLEELGSRVDALREPDKKLVVVLNADRKVEHGQVVEVIDALRQIKDVSMAIATEQPKQQ